MNEAENIRKLVNNSQNPKLVREVLNLIIDRFPDMDLQDYRWQVLCNHVAAMADRSVRNEKIEPVDPEIFEDISEQSVDLAKEVVAKIGNLCGDEAYLLSVHFEVVNSK